MARIGKVILFAGLIMSAVFLAFVTQPDVIAKMFGLGLGLAILIDVLFVRLVIAPAVVTLLGDHAWWLPGWLDRLLPNVSLEGHLVRGPRRGGRARARAPSPSDLIYLIASVACPAWTATEAARSFFRVLNRVAAGEEVEVTRSGAPVAVIVPPKASSCSLAASSASAS